MFDVILYDALTGEYLIHPDVIDWDDAIELCEEWVEQDPDLSAYVISAWGRICLYFEGV